MIIKLDGEEFKLKRGEWISTPAHIGLFVQTTSIKDEVEMEVVYHINEYGELENVIRYNTKFNCSNISHIGNAAFSKLIQYPNNFAQKEYVKDGQVKPRISLVPPLALEEVAKVFTYGADKYSAYNFSKGALKSTYIDAAMRHLLKYSQMEDVDDESGLFHLAHASSCLMMLLDNDLNNTSVEDRNEHYKKNN